MEYDALASNYYTKMIFSDFTLCFLSIFSLIISVLTYEVNFNIDFTELYTYEEFEKDPARRAYLLSFTYNSFITFIMSIYIL
jgi:hypothetical protein